MIKKLLAVMLALFAAAAFAAVDANKATQAELESIKGIGPVIATKILDERKKGSFKDWNDMVTRVKGVGDQNAAKFSTDGLTVNGAAFAGAPAAAAKPAEKSAMKADSKTPAAADAGGAKTAKTTSKASESTTATPKADTKAAAATTAADEKKKKAEERAAAKEAKAKEKAAKKAAASASAPAKK